MAQAIFYHDPNSKYKDTPGVRYHFPKRYLGIVKECVGDWIVYYEGKKGALGYIAVQKLSSVTADPDLAGHFFAWFERNILWDFEQVVPRNSPMGIAYERSLRQADGRAMSGGANMAAVRRISLDEFQGIVMAGLAPQNGPLALPRDVDRPGLAEDQAVYTPVLMQDIRNTVLQNRAKRDASFARSVKEAYQGRCAISGLDLRNGGGRAEVQAAHIRPVHAMGPDTVQNGLALSGTLHWMFDRGLIGIGDNYEILVSENKVPVDVRQRLICPSGQLHLPKAKRHHPHPEFIRYHRENVFGAAA